MVVLACYGLIIHLLSFVVLYVKYTYLKGKLWPVEDSPSPASARQPATTTTNPKVSSESAATGASPQSSMPAARPPKQIVPAATGAMDNEIEC